MRRGERLVHYRQSLPAARVLFSAGMTSQTQVIKGKGGGWAGDWGGGPADSLSCGDKQTYKVADADKSETSKKVFLFF